MLSSIFSLSDTSSYVGPAGTVGPMLACPSAVGEYTAFLRIHKYVTKVSATNPMTTATMKVMTTLIATATPVERWAVVGTECGGQTITNLVGNDYNITIECFVNRKSTNSALYHHNY